MTPFDYWPSCGHTQLRVNGQGHLTVTDDFLRFLLERPELAPIATSCAAEVALHHSLVEQPRREVTAQEVAELQDKDAADNYADAGTPDAQISDYLLGV